VSSEEFAGTPAEKELIEMIDSLYQRYDAHYAEAEKISDPAQKDKFYLDFCNLGFQYRLAMNLKRLRPDVV
jgi:hypothetical protein